jgi:hypothetical protein
MERVHQLLAKGPLHIRDVHFWDLHWTYIASAKVPLATKVAAYQVLKVRGIANINKTSGMDLSKMIHADRAFVAALDLDARTIYGYRVCVAWIDDDVAAFAELDQEGGAYDSAAGQGLYSLRDVLRYVLLRINAPRCTRFLFQDKDFREWVLTTHLSPLVLQLVEELVQPTDHLCREWLLKYGQSVKLIGMCVPDEELVDKWLTTFVKYPHSRGHMSVLLARKLHALATPEQSAVIESKLLRAISHPDADDGCFELAWLFGRPGPFDPEVQEYFLKRNVTLFPAFTFAMIVAMCDGYLKVARGRTATQKRFFALTARLPMDLQALVSLQLWGQTATVIRSEKFNRAFLLII